ncbi:T9SS type A sorting domain-containing protein [Flavobacterium sp. AS60]|uniref:T9SS type A sorting domain-containing protein n=1 Tax=Flavobacterium anseongense TaxID=2910677 RepID=UPI001F186458|nr:T9SS type A sorting domain-containing protein [Flavobacterium sp. AS60]MCF6128488.1 T9SS type A sorting domain-containing protein [Flavobacterium sp. AS60]
MKKLFFLAMFMLISLSINAQNEEAAQPKALDSLLTNIDKSLVTSEIIYERTLQLADLYNYNSEGYANTANFDYFRQSLLEMYRASNAKKFISLDELDSKISNSTDDNIVSIGILNTQFNVLNYNEEEPLKGGLLLDTITKKFVQIPNTTPFYMMHNTVIAPLKDAIDGKDITYKFTNEFFFNNGDKTIKGLTVDFGNGTKKDIIVGGNFNEQNITIPYDKSGSQKLIFTIAYSDGSNIVTNAEIYFRNINLNSADYVSCANSSSDQLRQDYTNFQADIDFTGYREGDPKIKSKIDYRIYYSNGNTQKLLKKPIIIIDGFDPGDTRKIEDCDCEQDAVCASKHKDQFGNFDPESHRSITDMMVYYDNDHNATYLLPKLRTLGYDVIIVNFPNYSTTNLNNGQGVAINGGAYYIESNAMSVIKLIKNVRDQLVTNGSDKQIAIIAPSMAGQISRYALSYMEKKFQDTNDNDWKHNVYLWVSVDSPHLGANIPLGDQALLSLAKSSSAAANDFYRKQLSSPAAQQQLIEFHRDKTIPNFLYPQFSSNPFTTTHNIAEPEMLNGQTTSFGMSANNGNIMFQEHYNRQNSNGITGSSGWPQNLRKIAVVNGSLTGSKETQAINGDPLPTFANAGEKVLNIRGFQRIHINLPIGSVTWYIHIASLESQFMPKTGETKRICRFKKAFNDKTTIATNLNERGVMDNVPGGFFDAQQQIAGPTLTQNVVPGTYPLNSFNDFGIANFIFSLSQSLGGSRWFLHEFNPIHSFIPTFSAIAHLEPDQNWNNPLDDNLACPTNRKTPFDSYFGGSKNTQHTSFTKECVDWLLEELAGHPQLPNYPLDRVVLDGPDIICSYDTDTVYNFDDICKLPGQVENWQISDNLQITNQSGTSVTIRAINGVQGTVTAVFNNGKTISKHIWINKPYIHNNNNNPNPAEFEYNVDPYLTDNEPMTLCLGGDTYENKKTILVSGLDSSSQWEIVKLTQNFSYIRNENVIYLNPYNLGQISFKVRVTNSCGVSNWGYYTMTVLDCNDNSYMRTSQTNIYTVYPNPSNNLVYVDLINQNNKPETGTIISGQLYDLMGYFKSNVEIIDNKATFSVQNLSKGIYALKIFINGQMESHLIAVE